MALYKEPDENTSATMFILGALGGAIVAGITIPTNTNPIASLSIYGFGFVYAANIANYLLVEDKKVLRIINSKEGRNMRTTIRCCIEQGRSFPITGSSSIQLAAKEIWEEEMTRYRDKKFLDDLLETSIAKEVEKEERTPFETLKEAQQFDLGSVKGITLKPLFVNKESQENPKFDKEVTFKIKRAVSDGYLNIDELKKAVRNYTNYTNESELAWWDVCKGISYLDLATEVIKYLPDWKLKKLRHDAEQTKKCCPWLKDKPTESLMELALCKELDYGNK